MVLPTLLDSAPRWRVATWQRARPPDSVYRTLAFGPAAPRTRVFPAKGNTGTHDLLKVPKVLTAANFVELRLAELRRIPLPRTPLNKGQWVGEGSSDPALLWPTTLNSSKLRFSVAASLGIFRRQWPGPCSPGSRGVGALPYSLSASRDVPEDGSSAVGPSGSPLRLTPSSARSPAWSKSS